MKNKVYYLRVSPRGIHKERTFNFEASLGVLYPLAVPMKLLLIIICLLLVSCASVKVLDKNTVASSSIIGYWQGCDDRIIEFTQEKDSIFGYCRKLGKLDAFGFTENELGYKLIQTKQGAYQGKVKWRFKEDTTIQWKPVRIQIENNNYSDTGSDACGSTMTRINHNNHE